jgi:hypothetical protein
MPFAFDAADFPEYDIADRIKIKSQNLVGGLAVQ